MSDTWKGKEYFLISATAYDCSEMLPLNSLYYLFPSWKTPKSSEFLCWRPIHLDCYFICFFLVSSQAVSVSGFRPTFLKQMKLCTLSNKQKCIY